jgi:hypothetical protein|tara:strand:+ start:232 stop:486 length:255 start_codon:yes stop_codon:yes gene_type:complete
MKITKSQLKKVIKEELSSLDEIAEQVTLPPDLIQNLNDTMDAIYEWHIAAEERAALDGSATFETIIAIDGIVNAFKNKVRGTSY